jgi:ATP phosphoribosyltransferase regulatory subunit
MQFINIESELNFTQKRKTFERTFEDYFESKGYQFIEPKIFQSYQGFVCANMSLDSKKTVKVLSGDSEIMILRPDNTMNILDRILKNPEREKPLKVFYNSKIYVNDNSSKIGEYRQMGAEYLGEDSIKADQEIIAMAVELMKRLPIPFILELGSSKYIDGLFDDLDITWQEKQQLRELIARKNQGELNIFLSYMDIAGPQKDLLSKILTMQGDIDSVIKMAVEYPRNKNMQEAIEELESLRDFFEKENIKQCIHFDLSMVPDLDYYDGMIFKGYYFNSPKKIISGGRYDSLTEKFGKRVSAIGFSINMEEVTRLYIQEEK